MTLTEKAHEEAVFHDVRLRGWIFCVFMWLTILHDEWVARSLEQLHHRILQTSTSFQLY